MNGRVAYALGYTGLGVAASRFGASVMLDHLYGRRSLAAQTEFVKSQMQAMSEQAKELGSSATKAAMDTSKPKG